MSKLKGVRIDNEVKGGQGWRFTTGTRWALLYGPLIAGIRAEVVSSSFVSHLTSFELASHSFRGVRYAEYDKQG